MSPLDHYAVALDDFGATLRESCWVMDRRRRLHGGIVRRLNSARARLTEARIDLEAVVGAYGDARTRSLFGARKRYDSDARFLAKRAAGQ